MFCNTDIDWSATGSMLSAIAAFVAIIAVWYQISQVRKSLDDSNIMKVLEIEFELNRRRERSSDLKMEIIKNTKDKLKIDYSQEEIQAFKDSLAFYDASYENYLNCLDRMCFFIIRGSFSEIDFREDYKKTLDIIVNSEDFNEKFNGQANYKNIVRLQQKWN